MLPILALLASVGGLKEDPKTKSINEADELEVSEAINTRELKAHVERLASSEFLGRRGPGAARAAQYLAAALERSGLKPAFGDSYVQDIPSRFEDAKNAPNGFIGRNVGGLVPGTDPVLKDQWILVSAHYDHLGRNVKTNRLYPGADDNATGVAMLLEVGEYFAQRKIKPRRTLLFVAFDQEENGLLGSLHFAANPPRPFKNLKAVVTADMLGRSMANVMDEYVFVLGSEHSELLRQRLQDVAPPDGLKLGRIGADLIGTRSDYGPFRDRKVPFLFVSTGQHEDYHRTTDTPDKVDYEKLKRISCWIADLLVRLSTDDAAPVWSPQELPADLDEIRTVHTLVRRVLDRPEKFPLTAKKREIVAGVEAKLAATLKRGVSTSDDRSWLMWTGRLLLSTVF